MAVSIGTIHQFTASGMGSGTLDIQFNLSSLSATGIGLLLFAYWGGTSGATFTSITLETDTAQAVGSAYQPDSNFRSAAASVASITDTSQIAHVNFTSGDNAGACNLLAVEISSGHDTGDMIGNVATNYTGSEPITCSFSSKEQDGSAIVVLIHGGSGDVTSGGTGYTGVNINDSYARAALVYAATVSGTGSYQVPAWSPGYGLSAHGVEIRAAGAAGPTLTQIERGRTMGRGIARGIF